MATINPTGQWIEKGVHKTTWAGLGAAADVGGAQGGANLSDKTIYVTGVMNSAVVTVQGSNNTATGPWVPLVDPQGNALALASGTIEVILENPQFIRPNVSGATGNTTDFDVIMVSRGSR